MATKRSAFEDTVGQASEERKSDGRYLKASRKEYKGKMYIAIGWCIDNKAGETIYLAGKQTWIPVEAYADFYEIGLTPAYKIVSGKK